MNKIVTDKNIIEQVLSRGVEKIYPGKEELKKKLLSGDKIRLYCGFDPSAKSLHIGNAITLSKLAEFQKLGHEIIFLIGDFTGMIGDPTDKKATRKQLSREEVLENAKHYKQQAAPYISFEGENPAKVKYNSEWNDKLSFKDIIELSANFTVQQMIQRDMFQERLKEEKAIYLHEFLYPLTQGYDSVAMDVDLEVGGNDQMFNMMCGRDLQKAINHKEKAVLTMKLLTDAEGKKMGKSEGNMVNLDESPENMYGKIMSWSDGVLSSAFELCTQLPYEEILKIQKDLKEGQGNPRDFKMRLAYEVTRINHGTEKAEAAQNNFIKTVQNKEIPEKIEEIKIKAKKINILDLLLEAKLATSKSEAKRLLEQGGIKINEEVISNAQQEIEIKEDFVLQRGKRQFIKIKA